MSKNKGSLKMNEKKVDLESKAVSKEERSDKIAKYVGYGVLISLVIPVVILGIVIMLWEDGHVDPLTGRSKTDYVLMLIQCLLGIFALVIPDVLTKRNLKIPSGMYIVYVIFLYCAIFLGEVRNFYYKIPNWDLILHTFSGGMMGALGFSFVSLLNKTEDFHLKLTPGFVAFFSFMLSVMLGVFWEIYEFAADGFLGLNMQKFMLESGELLVGREALSDTMWDLIVDMVGAFVMSVIGYVSLKYKKGWIENLIIRVKKKVGKDSV